MINRMYRTKVWNRLRKVWNIVQIARLAKAKIHQKKTTHTRYDAHTDMHVKSELRCTDVQRASVNE